MKIKERLCDQKGISVIFLIFVVAILIGISILMYRYYEQIVEEEKITDITTNMYTLNTNATEMLNANLHQNKELLGTKLESCDFELNENEVVYELSSEDAMELGINIDISEYLLVYNMTDKTTDVIYKEGIEDDSNNIVYRLSQIE